MTDRSSEARKQPAKRAASKEATGEAESTHDVKVETHSTALAGGQGGYAQAMCSCGWTHTVIYQRDRHKETSIEAAKRSGALHVEDAD